MFHIFVPIKAFMVSGRCLEFTHTPPEKMWSPQEIAIRNAQCQSQTRNRNSTSLAHVSWCFMVFWCSLREDDGFQAMQRASTATLWSGRDQWSSESDSVFQQLREVAVRVSSSKGTGHGIFHRSAEADPAGWVKHQITAGWWFGTWLLFFHILGIIIKID